MALFGRKSRAPRHRVEKEAWLVLDRSFALRPCKVVDLSDTGARLYVGPGDRIPKHFNLTFTRSSREGPRCELRWQRGHSIGVKFVG
ncbi:PilZ domain-containing protein [Pseudorhodoplanes sp.]|uniref:PilZ domain-containing protein n=1 Tax=Pseudorhodoplanes sp. TaxID=1934341 RepID=UPI003D144E51